MLRGKVAGPSVDIARRAGGQCRFRTISVPAGGPHFCGPRRECQRESCQYVAAAAGGHAGVSGRVYVACAVCGDVCLVSLEHDDGLPFSGQAHLQRMHFGQRHPFRGRICLQSVCLLPCISGDHPSELAGVGRQNGPAGQAVQKCRLCSQQVDGICIDDDRLVRLSRLSEQRLQKSGRGGRRADSRPDGDGIVGRQVGNGCQYPFV